MCCPVGEQVIVGPPRACKVATTVSLTPSCHCMRHGLVKQKKHRIKLKGISSIMFSEISVKSSCTKALENTNSFTVHLYMAIMARKYNTF